MTVFVVIVMSLAVGCLAGCVALLVSLQRRLTALEASVAVVAERPAGLSVDDAESVFAQVSRDVRSVAEQLGIADAHAVPVSALLGDNIVEPSTSTPWYAGPSLLGLLETLSPSAEADEEPFRFTV